MTGVQTCALPISDFFKAETAASGREQDSAKDRNTKWPILVSGEGHRSEERRVGKEGRSRWSPDH